MACDHLIAGCGALPSRRREPGPSSRRGTSPHTRSGNPSDRQRAPRRLLPGGQRESAGHAEDAANGIQRDVTECFRRCSSPQDGAARARASCARGSSGSFRGRGRPPRASIDAPPGRPAGGPTRNWRRRSSRRGAPRRRRPGDRTGPPGHERSAPPSPRPAAAEPSPGTGSRPIPPGARRASRLCAAGPMEADREALRHLNGWCRGCRRGGMR